MLYVISCVGPRFTNIIRKTGSNMLENEDTVYDMNLVGNSTAYFLGCVPYYTLGKNFTATSPPGQLLQLRSFAY